MSSGQQQQPKFRAPGKKGGDALVLLQALEVRPCLSLLAHHYASKRNPHHLSLFHATCQSPPPPSHDWILLEQPTHLWWPFIPKHCTMCLLPQVTMRQCANSPAGSNHAENKEELLKLWDKAPQGSNASFSMKRLVRLILLYLLSKPPCDRKCRPLIRPSIDCPLACTCVYVWVYCVSIDCVPFVTCRIVARRWINKTDPRYLHSSLSSTLNMIELCSVWSGGWGGVHAGTVLKHHQHACMPPVQQ